MLGINRQSDGKERETKGSKCPQIFLSDFPLREKELSIESNPIQTRMVGVVKSKPQ